MELSQPQKFTLGKETRFIGKLLITIPNLINPLCQKAEFSVLQNP